MHIVVFYVVSNKRKPQKSTQHRDHQLLSSNHCQDSHAHHQSSKNHSYGQKTQATLQPTGHASKHRALVTFTTRCTCIEPSIFIEIVSIHCWIRHVIILKVYEFHIQPCWSIVHSQYIEGQKTIIHWAQTAESWTPSPHPSLLTLPYS